MRVDESGLRDLFTDACATVDEKVAAPLARRYAEKLPAGPLDLPGKVFIEPLDPATGVGRVGNHSPIALYLEEGTRPHAIPNAFGYGENFGLEPDFHPGNRPYLYLHEALAEAETGGLS